MKILKKHKATKALKQVAKNNGVTLDEVRREIELCIIEGMQSDDPQAKKLWAEVAPNGITPTPEELICFLTEKLNQNTSKPLLS